MCSGVHRQADILHLMNDNLHRTRDLLLPRLISGEVDLAEMAIGTGGMGQEN